MGALIRKGRPTLRWIRRARQPMLFYRYRARLSAPVNRDARLRVREDYMNERLAFGSPIDGLLDRLYARNVAQNDALATYFTARAAEGSLDWNQFDQRTNEFLKDKLIALDRSKAEFCYRPTASTSTSSTIHAMNCAP